MNNGGSHFLYHRERIIRFKMAINNLSQKKFAKQLGFTESYISKLITGERYNQDFEELLKLAFNFDYSYI
jgi:transcriptional regulator with XRE-family HTH domain